MNIFNYDHFWDSLRFRQNKRRGAKKRRNPDVPNQLILWPQTRMKQLIDATMRCIQKQPHEFALDSASIEEPHRDSLPFIIKIQEQA